MKGQTFSGERPGLGLGPEPYVLLGVEDWKMGLRVRDCVRTDLMWVWLRRAA